VPTFLAPDDMIPALTTGQMIEVDRLMTEEFGVDLVRMMESAGRHLAELARTRFLDGDATGRTVVVLAGAGGNGGGGLVAARRLHAWGANVVVALSSERALFHAVPAAQLAILDKHGVPVVKEPELPAAPDLVIDALIGYSLRGDPRGTAAELIRWTNARPAQVLSLDLPSGVDGAKGPSALCVRANATMTLALPKVGLYHDDAGPLVGELYLADIGVPPALYAAEHLDLDLGPLFHKADLLRLA
jgi:NAD(P)H-hydrate epimerase